MLVHLVSYTCTRPHGRWCPPARTHNTHTHQLQCHTHTYTHIHATTTASAQTTTPRPTSRTPQHEDGVYSGSPCSSYTCTHAHGGWHRARIHTQCRTVSQHTHIHTPHAIITTTATHHSRAHVTVCTLWGWVTVCVAWLGTPIFTHSQTHTHTHICTG